MTSVLALLSTDGQSLLQLHLDYNLFLLIKIRPNYVFKGFFFYLFGDLKLVSHCYFHENKFTFLTKKKISLFKLCFLCALPLVSILHDSLTGVFLLCTFCLVYYQIFR